MVIFAVGIERMKKFFHISLSILLLAATAGVSVSKHICGGTIYDIAINKKAASCHGGHDAHMPGCCDDETERHQVDDDFQAERFEIPGPVSLAPAIQSILLPGIPVERAIDINSFLATFKSPPCPGKDIVVKAQAFLL